METDDMKEFAEAMLQFQFECPAIFKDEQVEVKMKEGPGKYTFEFASYGNIIQSIKPFMYAAKLTYKFLTRDTKFICRIRHVSGQFEDTEIDMPKMRERMQDNGAMLSYLKRYSLVLALGIDTDADNDGADEGDAKKRSNPKGVDADIKKFLKTTDLSKYMVKVGKFKNMTLGEIDQLKIQDYLTWLHGQAKTNNRPLSGDWLEFAKVAESYIAPPETPPEQID